MVSLKDLSPAKRLSEALAPNPGDNSWLDLLRTLAIALVFLRHGQRVLDMGETPGFLEFLSINGWAGVDLFFVLSGYLVTAGLLRRHAERGFIDLGQFALKRIRRIVPAYYAVLALVLIGYFPDFTVSDQSLGTRVLYHLLFLQDVFPSDINVVFWSLGVEAKYYALVPFLVLPFLRLSSLKLILGLGLLAVLLGPALRWLVYANAQITDYQVFWQTLRSPFYACLEPFALGFLVAVLEKRGAIGLAPKVAATLFLAMLGLLAAFLGSHVLLAQIGIWDATLQPLLLAVIFAGLVTAAINMAPMQSRLEPVVRFGARISYALYLVHLPLIPLSVGLTSALGLGVPAFWALYASISILHALVILCYIEMPCMSLGHRPDRVLQPKDHRPSAVN